MFYLVVVSCLDSLPKLGLLRTFFLPSFLLIGELGIYFFRFRFAWSCFNNPFLFVVVLCAAAHG